MKGNHFDMPLPVRILLILMMLPVANIDAISRNLHQCSFIVHRYNFFYTTLGLGFGEIIDWIKKEFLIKCTFSFSHTNRILCVNLYRIHNTMKLLS